MLGQGKGGKGSSPSDGLAITGLMFPGFLTFSVHSRAGIVTDQGAQVLRKSLNGQKDQSKVSVWAVTTDVSGTWRLRAVSSRLWRHGFQGLVYCQ